MKILLTGAAGQLGQELTPLLGGLGELHGVDRDVPQVGHGLLRQDLSDFIAVEALLDTLRPDAIVNAAAYTAVDRAESDRELAFRVNAGLPECLAAWTKRNDGLLLHYSTDYVFAGDVRRPYRESDAPNPLNVYGESKLAGEEAIVASRCRHLVLRTSWVWSGQGNNFLLTMLRLAAERPSLRIVDDQFGCPTWARNLARVSRSLLEQLRAPGEGRWGTYHYSDADTVSWYGFARAIFKAAVNVGLIEAAPELEAVDSAEFPQEARRPAYSVMDTSLIRKHFGIEPAGLESSLAECLEEMSDELT